MAFGRRDRSAEQLAALPQLDLITPEAVLRRLEYTVRTRLDGLLQGNYLGFVLGPGTETGESRQYSAGDDVRRMDWPVTARTTVPHVRQTVADRELETWLAIDLSPSLDFGTVVAEKRQLVFAAITAVVHLTQKVGNRVGAVVTNGDDTFRIPARAGRVHARHLIDRVAAVPRGTAGNGTELTDLLEALRRPPRRRGLIAVVSDFVEPVAAPGTPPSWERPLRGLGDRHQLLAIEVLDPQELQLPAAGLVTFTDPESGQQLEVQTSDAAVRARFAEAALAQRQRIAAGLRHAGAAHLQLRTDGDWVGDIVRFTLARRQTGPATAAARR